MSENSRYKEQEGTVWYPFSVLFLGAILGLYGIIYAIDHNLPTPLEIKDESENPEAFIAERARDYLKPLVEIGPKVAGHESHELAVKYLEEKINEIIGGAHENQRIVLDVSEVSGSFYLDYKPYGAIINYKNVINVAVKIHSKDDAYDSVLINTHYDTVPGSPGGSDDGINVAVSLEILKKLSKSPVRPTNNLIFLFNGAEEAGLVAAHGFITTHRWSQEVRVLVNLEATGGGGKEILFQTGPDEPWLLKYYDVPHPHGNAAGEEVFQSNIIPSDTDFRIFRDFGGVVGYDFAFTRDGYRYHTRFDGFDNIEYGRYQHTGDNILRLVKNLAEAPEVAKPITKKGKTVYYDFLGWFFLYYDENIATIVNSAVAAVSFVLILWAFFNVEMEYASQKLIYITILAFVVIFGWFLAGILVYVISLIMDACDRTMTWYNFTVSLFGLYGVPTCLTIIITRIIINTYIPNKYLTISKKAFLQANINLLVWTVILLIGTVFQIRMIYVVMVCVFFTSIAMLIVNLLDFFNQGFSEKAWPFIYIIFLIPPTMMILNYGHEVIALFTPILGRFGSSTNPDMLIGLAFAFFTIFVISHYVPLLLYVKKPWTIVIVLGALFIATIIVVSTPAGFPYKYSISEPRLQRYYIYHIARTLRNDANEVMKQDHGFHFTKMDRNVPHSIEREVSFLDRATSLKDDCDLVLACGLPVTNSRSLKSVENSVWIPSSQAPVYPSALDYNFTKTDLSPTRTEYVFNIGGCDRIDIYLSLRENIRLDRLSLVDKVPENHLEWNGQDTHYISFVQGNTKEATLSFTFVIEKPSGWMKPAVDIAMAAKYVHDDRNILTQEYSEFLGEFPDWTVFGVNGLAYYENIVLM